MILCIEVSYTPKNKEGIFFNKITGKCDNRIYYMCITFPRKINNNNEIPA